MKIHREDLAYNQQRYYIKDTNGRSICVGISSYDAVEGGGYKVFCTLISFKPTKLDSVDKCEQWLRTRLKWILKQLQNAFDVKGNKFSGSSQNQPSWRDKNEVGTTTYWGV